MKIKPEAARRRLARARSALHADPPIRYKLGKGGFDPSLPTPAPTGECDCSGFVAWCLGLGRDQRRAHGFWISTTDIVRDALGAQRLFVRLEGPEPGCVAAYPDRAGRQGHAAIVAQARPLAGIDCSSARNGVAERPLGFFLRKAPVFCALRDDILKEEEA